MSILEQILENHLRTYIETINPPTFQNIVNAIQDDLEVLTENGLLDLGPDIGLTGKSLEIKIKLLFSSMGFDINNGRNGFEDFVISPTEGMKPRDPLVLEVKSSRKPNISRDNLRQLDDWVFDLSGEEKARKHGLGGGFDALSFATNGMLSQPKKHPTPHKGVLIFNGPVGLSFENRPPTSIGYNEYDFMNKRNLCVIPLNVLQDYFIKFQDRPEIKDILWEKIHKTIGELEII
jgi:hypothetical protein